jgi:hypothetical protein
MDNRANNGGSREGAGRKPKSKELELIESLDKHIDQEEVFDTLHGLIKEGNIRAIQLYMNYRHGKPKENVTLSSDGFNINFKDLLKFE